MKVKIKDKEYKVIKDFGDTISTIDLNELVTDYYDNYDYLVGDWAYGKVRIKGFYKNDNKLVKEFNNIDNVENYIKNYCAYGCKYFILEYIEN